jgi:membrane-associated phospholipid phosphatase
MNKSSELTRRLAWSGLVIVFTLGGYNLVGRLVDPARAVSLESDFDTWIPFVPWTVYIYSWVYTSMLFPLFTVRCPRLFRRVVVAYTLLAAGSMIIFALFPVTSIDFRPDVATLSDNIFHEWACKLTYFIDPPTNCFPSQHTSVAAIAMLVAYTARPLYGLFALPIVLGILITISTMKQHYVVDGLGALVFSGIVYLLVIRPYDPKGQTPRELSYTWRGPVTYLFFHVAVYGVFMVAYAFGWLPWA